MTLQEKIMLLNWINLRFIMVKKRMVQLLQNQEIKKNMIIQMLREMSILHRIRAPQDYQLTGGIGLF